MNECKAEGITERFLVEVMLKDKRMLICNVLCHCSGLSEFGDREEVFGELIPVSEC